MRTLILSPLLVFVVTLLLFCSPSVASTQAYKNVLILDSYHHGAVFHDTMVHGIEQYLQDHLPGTNIFKEYMDAKRFQLSQAQEQILVELYTLKYQQRRPEVLVAIGEYALNFARKNREVLFPGVPIVFLGIHGVDDNTLGEHTNITGIVETVAYQKNIDLIVKLHPGVKNIVAVVDTSKAGHLMLDEFRRIVADKEGGGDRFEFKVVSPDNLAKELDHFTPADTVLLPIHYFLPPDYRSQSDTRANGAFYQKKGFPVYAGYSQYVDGGPLGGAVIDGNVLGRQAGQAVVRIVEGEDADVIPIQRNSSVIYTFDYAQLSTFGLRAGDLPENTILINTPLQSRDQYRYLLWGAVVTLIILGLVITFWLRNVTARKNAEENLLQQETHLKTLVETIPDLVWLKDVNGFYLACNLRFEKFYGAKQSEIIGKTDYDFVDKDLADFFRKHDRIAIEAGKPCSNEEEVVYAFDGHKGLLETIKTPMYNNFGEIIGVLGVGRDITDRKKMEMNLQQSQKMEAIGTLAGGIAHDFNNILTAVIGFSELAYDVAEPDTTVSECLRQIIGASDRAKDLVEQILAFSRQGNSEIVPLDMKRVVEKAVSFLRPSLPTTITIDTEIGQDNGIVSGDATQLHQILVNLCTNAFHAMEEEGGKLTIGLQDLYLTESDIPEQTTVSPGEYIKLSVTDTGVGIGQEHLERIFDPYFTTKAPGKGTGMGLSIVHGIVLNMEGFVTVGSRLGEGTHVDVYLPVKDPQEVIENSFDDSIPLGSERILFVDDEKMLADLAEKMLIRLGYQVTISMSSVEALEIFRQQGNDFDLVVTDQTMPIMDGATLSIKMLQINPDIPIVLCTGYSSVISEKRAKDLGIKELVYKPLRTKEIAQVLRKVLDEGQ